MPFSSPNTNEPVDVDAHIALLPKNASGRGVLFSDIIDRVKRHRPYIDLEELAGLEKRRYVPFFQYPYADLLKLCVAGAKAMYPKRSIGDALRKMGQRVYTEFVETHAGRVMFGALGNDTETVVVKGPKAYRLSLNFGDVTSKLIEPRCAKMEFRRFPGLIATYQVGVIEGAIMATRMEPNVTIELFDIANADVLVKWNDIPPGMSLRPPSTDIDSSR